MIKIALFILVPVILLYSFMLFYGYKSVKYILKSDEDLERDILDKIGRTVQKDKNHIFLSISNRMILIIDRKRYKIALFSSYVFGMYDISGFISFKRRRQLVKKYFTTSKLERTLEE